MTAQWTDVEIDERLVRLAQAFGLARWDRDQQVWFMTDKGEQVLQDYIDERKRESA